MIVKTLTVTPFEQNCRLLIDEKSSKAVLLDPGGDVPTLLAEIKNAGAVLDSVWLTHSHIDHAAGVAELREKSPDSFKLYAHEAEKAMRARILDQAMMFGLDQRAYRNCPEPDVYLQEGDMLEFAGSKVRVLFTPGHSPGHLCFYFERRKFRLESLDAEPEEFETELLLAGDTLFYGSIGRTDLPGSVHQDLMRSIKDKLFSLSDDTLVLPGHGPYTSVGREKKYNPFL